MNKETYITPMMDICAFEKEDIITTSGEPKSLYNGGTSATPDMISYTELFG